MLIDTVGMSQRDQLVAEQAALLAGGGAAVKRLLLLNATANAHTLDEVVGAYAKGGVHGCDHHQGRRGGRRGQRCSTSLIRHRLPLHYVTNGQRVPEDLHLPNRAWLLHRAVRPLAADSAHGLCQRRVSAAGRRRGAGSWRMLDSQRDQAEGLRRLFSRRRAHVVTVASGCNGVGATGTVVNLAAALAARGHRMLVIDENYGPANVAGSLGLRARRDLHDVVAGECALEDALLAAPGDITVLPAAAGVRALPRLDSADQARLTAALTRLGERFDILLIDARSGTVGGLSSLGHAVQDTVVVCSAASAAITESYALIKRLHGLTRHAPLPPAPEPRRRRGRRAPDLRQPRARVPQASRNAAGVSRLRAPRRAHAARGRDDAAGRDRVSRVARGRGVSPQRGSGGGLAGGPGRTGQPGRVSAAPVHGASRSAPWRG